MSLQKIQSQVSALRHFFGDLKEVNRVECNKWQDSNEVLSNWYEGRCLAYTLAEEELRLLEDRIQKELLANLEHTTGRTNYEHN